MRDLLCQDFRVCTPHGKDSSGNCFLVTLWNIRTAYHNIRHEQRRIGTGLAGVPELVFRYARFDPRRLYDVYEVVHGVVVVRKIGSRRYDVSNALEVVDMPGFIVEPRVLAPPFCDIVGELALISKLYVVRQSSRAQYLLDIFGLQRRARDDSKAQTVE